MASSRVRRWPAAAVASLLLCALPAQQGEPGTSPPQPPPTPEPGGEVVDPAQRAAEILRRRLGLDRGPTGTPPAGPTEPKPAAPTPQQPQPRQPESREPESEETQPQEPNPQPSKPEVRDPADQAARALQRLLPTGEPAEPPKPEPGAAPIAPPPIAPSADVAAPSSADAAGALAVSGALSTHYRGRHGGGASDQNLISRLNVFVGTSRDPWSVSLRTRLFVDLDGSRRDDPFPGLDHSFGDDVNARLYAVHLDLREVPELQLLRLGRQDLDETPVVLAFDGVRADTPRRGRASWWLTGYGGVPVHYFEASRSGDALVGAGGGFSPWNGGRVRLDWMWLRDEFLAVDRQDALLGVRWWQSFEDVTLRGFHSWRDGAPRDLLFAADGHLDAVGTLRFAFRELLSTQRQQVTDIDPYFAIAGELSPYRQVELACTRALTADVTAGVGLDLRRLRDASDEAAFNREFERYYADLTWRDVLAEGLSVNVAGNLYESSGESFHALTGELVYRPDATLRAVAGVGYDLFRYDALQLRERVRVRSFYLRLDRRVGEQLRVDCGYELQRDDLDEFHLFRLGVTWTL